MLQNTSLTIVWLILAVYLTYLFFRWRKNRNQLKDDLRINLGKVIGVLLVAIIATYALGILSIAIVDYSFYKDKIYPVINVLVFLIAIVGFELIQKLAKIGKANWFLDK